MSRILFMSAAALALSLSALPATAHVVADPALAEPGSYFRTALRVSHGCGSSPTTAIRVAIPEDVVSVRPQAKAGWQVAIETRKLAQPVEIGHGQKADILVSAVSWSGGRLPNEQFDEFGLVLKLPNQPGAQLWLPVVQTCEGGETRWEQIPAAGQSAHDLPRPAALIRVADATKPVLLAQAGHGHGMPAAPKAGDIAIEQPFARATPAKVGGVFMTLKNAGGTADRLMKAASPVAESVELHTHVKDGDAMRMRPVEDIPVPAKGQTGLVPGGYHVMLIGLKQPLKEGTQFPLTLTFEKAGTVTIQVPVMKAGSMGDAGNGGHKH
ncbi:DUF1775 domain-containing protein [Ferrovibrio sp.]|uniref:DUF1775 domain-containing protein n=1 Tax=Ferrovibrio sp. TaxID=1917215 RepID=UPI00261D93AD|nr:DUF1775 domain-containing protein [Ferrovibrio sp.]